MSIERTTVEQRKALPVASGVLDYFPDALLAVAEVSRVGNEQHHPGQPLHWDKSKSTDEADALLRHLIDRGTIDTDGMRHSAKVAWRALAMLQRELDAEAEQVGTVDNVTVTEVEDACPRYCDWKNTGVHDPWCEVSRMVSTYIERLDPELAVVAGLTDLMAGDTSILHPSFRGEYPVEYRGPDGILTCCLQSEHDIACPLWR